jgi:hypothetical protein
VVANALNVFRNGYVGFIGRLDSGVGCSLAARNGIDGCKRVSRQRE